MKYLIILIITISSINSYGQNAEGFYKLGKSKYKRMLPYVITPFSGNVSPEKDLKGIQSNKEAIEYFNKAIELNPAYADAYYARGLAKHALWDDEGAVADFSKTYEINPKHELALLELASLKLSTDKDAACKYYEKAIAIGSKRAKKFAKWNNCK